MEISADLTSMTGQNTIYSKIGGSQNLPSLPHILLKLIEVCNQKEAGIKDLAQVINMDPSISERVLRLVNSASYSLKHNVTSVDQALLLLGMDAVKNIALSASIYQVFNKTKGSLAFNVKLFWWHSLNCGVVARIMAQKLKYPSPDEAFLAGLLHDIGKLVLLVNFREEYTKILESANRQTSLLLKGELKLGDTHSAIGAWLIGRWNMRSFIPDAIRFHHEPVERIMNAFPLVQIVFAANLLCPVHSGLNSKIFSAVRQILSLKRQDIEEVLSKAEQEVGEIAKTFGIEIEPPVKDRKDEEKLEKLIKEVRDISLLHSALEGFLRAEDKEAVLKIIRQCLHLLFDFKNIYFFQYESNALIGRLIGSEGLDDLPESLKIPFREEASLLVQSLLRNTLLDSFTGSKKAALSIFDEQIIRIVGTEGFFSLPLLIGGDYLGVILLGVTEIEIANILKKRKLLAMFADQAVLTLHAHKIRVTEVKRIQEERFAASSILARKIVHEVNNPLGIINNYLSILSSKLNDNEQVQDELRVIKEEIKRVALLVSELSSFSSPVSQQREAVDVNRILSDIVKIARESVWQKSRIDLHLNLDPELPAIYSEKNKLKQVLINLIKNAVEAMPQGGNIFIETASYAVAAQEKTLLPGSGVGPEGAKQVIEIKVRDDGPGIPESVKKRLFEPFNGTKNQEGLGLSIVYRCIKELNGTISCDTTGKKGTVFTIVLPVA